MKNRATYLILFFALLSTKLWGAEVIIGNVCKKDSLVSAADYAMVYLPDYKVGTTANERGDFSLKLPAEAIGKNVRLEFSLIGYKTQWKNIDCTDTATQIVLDSVVLAFEPIMLAATYITPDGMDPAKYILSQVWKTADANKKMAKNYRARVHYDITTHKLPMITKVIPGFTLGFAKFIAAFMGIGPLVDYCLKNDDLYAQVSLERSVKNGRTKDSNIQMLQHTEGLPKAVQKNILAGFRQIDLYEMLYGNDNAWGRKFSKRSDFELVGSYTYDNKIVDVLHWEDPNSDATATIHVIEENWSILKVQVGRGEEAVICEARDMGNGIYMPVSFTMKPSLTRIKVKDIPFFIERLKTEKGISQTIRKNAIKLLEEHLNEGKDFNPYILGCYNVQYLEASNE